MSIPMRICSFVAAIDDPSLIPKLAKVFQNNIESGHFSLYGCNCDPPCREPTDKELNDLEKQLIDWKEP